MGPWIEECKRSKRERVSSRRIPASGKQRLLAEWTTTTCTQRRETRSHQITKGTTQEKRRETENRRINSNNKNNYNDCKITTDKPTTDPTQATTHPRTHTMEPLLKALGLSSKQRRPTQNPQWTTTKVYMILIKRNTSNSDSVTMSWFIYQLS